MRQQDSFRPALLSLLLIFTMMIGGGCRRDFATETDALRERVMLLEREVESLERRNAELRAELRRRARQRAEVSEEIIVATPQVVAIAIGRLSHGRLARDESEQDTLRIYINPTDSRGRFVHLIGTLRLHAAMMPDDAEPISVARAELSPEEVRDRYRSSFTGTHYTIHLPIDWPDDVDAETARTEPIILRVIFDDAHTGERHSAERSLTWRAGR